MKLVNARTLCLDLDMLDENDLHEERIDYPLALEQDKDHLPDPQRLKDRIAFHKKCLKKLEETGRKSLTFTDSGSAMMPAKEGGLKACYNVQTVVDAGSHMAVSFHVADNSSDRGQISGSMGLCKEELDLDAVSVIADKDYESAEDIRKCLLNGIVPEVRWIQDRKEQVFPMDYIVREIAAERKASTKPEDVQDCLQVGGLLRRYQHPHPGQSLGQVSCFIRHGDGRVTCPRGRELLKQKTTRYGIEYSSKETCHTCPNRCTAHRIQQYLCSGAYVRRRLASTPRDSGRGTTQPLQQFRQTEASGKAGNGLHPVGRGETETTAAHQRASLRNHQAL